MGWRSRLQFGLGVCLLAGFFWQGARQWRAGQVPPDAIFVLGGSEERELHAAELASAHPTLPVWVSSGSPRWYAERVFSRSGIPMARIHLDYRAQDTVTNFTTLADELQARGIDCVYLVTSEQHMMRARAIGEIVFGSRGILLKPVSVPSDRYLPAELQKTARDSLRSLLWVTSGRTAQSCCQSEQSALNP